MEEQKIKKPDGGQAFPKPDVQLENGEKVWGFDGMSLRDYFAAKAMEGLCSFPFKDDMKTSFVEWVSQLSYEIADEMIKQRIK
jgi:hypothetical protein